MPPTFPSPTSSAGRRIGRNALACRDPDGAGLRTPPAASTKTKFPEGGVVVVVVVRVAVASLLYRRAALICLTVASTCRCPKRLRSRLARPPQVRWRVVVVVEERGDAAQRRSIVGVVTADFVLAAVGVSQHKAGVQGEPAWACLTYDARRPFGDT